MHIKGLLLEFLEKKIFENSKVWVKLYMELYGIVILHHVNIKTMTQVYWNVPSQFSVWAGIHTVRDKQLKPLPNQTEAGAKM